MRRAAKIDAIQSEVVKALEARGHHVLSIAPLGNGAPDVLVGARRPTTRFVDGKPLRGFDRVLVLLELKSERNQRGDLEPLTPLEEEFHRKWRAYPVYVAGSVDDAIRVVEGGE